jgi:hypothetical protein
LEGKKESGRETDRSRGSETQGSLNMDSVPSGKEEGSQGHRQMPRPKLPIRGKGQAGQAGQVRFGRRRTGTDRQTGEAAGLTAGMMPLSLPRAWSLVRKEKEEEERTRTRGLRDSWKPGWVSRWRTPKPDSPGGKGGGERDLETESAPVPALLQAQQEQGAQI